MKTKLLLFALLLLGVSSCGKSTTSKNQSEEQTNEVSEEPIHTWVDLGLSVKWATTNIGANNPEDYGDSFAWGEVTPKTEGSWDTYKWYDQGSLTKYCAEDNKTILDLEDDAAYVNWGCDWRMPTLDELYDLLSKCSWSRTTRNGVNGYQVTGTNGNSIFLPSSGEYSTSYYTSKCYVSGSEFGDPNYEQAYSLEMSDNWHNWLAKDRYYCTPIRPVYVGDRKNEEQLDCSDTAYIAAIQSGDVMKTARIGYERVFVLHVENSDEVTEALKEAGKPFNREVSIEMAALNGVDKLDAIVASIELACEEKNVEKTAWFIDKMYKLHLITSMQQNSQICNAFCKVGKPFTTKLTRYFAAMQSNYSDGSEYEIDELKEVVLDAYREEQAEIVGLIMTRLESIGGDNCAELEAAFMNTTEECRVKASFTMKSIY